MYPNLQLEQNDGILTITIDRPKQLNALNKETIAALSSALDAVSEDAAVQVVIITGSGEKAFVAGADIKEFAAFSIEEGAKLAEVGHEQLFNKIERFPKPVIAAVNGFALGGGLELAMSCHIRVASENAKVGLPEVTLGVIPGYGGTQRLPQLVGKGKAFEMIFTGGMIAAAEALDWGLVNHVVPQESLLETCRGMAQKIARNSPNAIREAIGAVNAGFATGVDGYQAEIAGFGNCFATPEFEEGTQAFMEKRRPDFKNAKQ
ncbi:MAG: enoyl-CoA hydratase/isomerase family protein [Schleiferiaceae bacterium]|nr:enoyl-CoA hydratase/isomerase family protein [Schleiferiaceae bacterium]